MYNLIKQLVEKILPESLVKRLKDVNLAIKLRKVRKNHQKTLVQIRKKEKIKVAFFLIHKSVWKYEGVYKLMEQDYRFKPVVVVCPHIVYGEENMLHDMRTAYSSFKKRGYNVIKTLKEETNEWLDVKKEIKPDIVFFTNPHKLTRDEYYINNYLDTLTCYVPYGIMTANIQETQYNQLFHNLIWRCFYETTVHKNMAEKYARNKGENVIVTGFPMCDVFLDKNHKFPDGWKIKDRKIKRIIWAPHHTIENNEKELAYSNFLSDYNFMIDICRHYKGRIQIAFKPHPILKLKLFKHKDWGKDKTEAYFETWKNSENGQLEESGYIDLFLSSDAMILDSISFMAEYCYTGKPSLFLVRDNTIEKKFNEFGEKVFSLMYKSYNNADIMNFIDKIVLKEQDALEKERQDFIEKYLKPPKNKTACENVFNHITNGTIL